MTLPAYMMPRNETHNGKTINIGGKQRPKHNARALPLRNYVNPSVIPTAPASTDRLGGVPNVETGFFGMCLNNKLGTCGIAGPDHLINFRSFLGSGKELVVPDSVTEQVYSDISGYNPQTGANDDGCALTDVLEHWRTVGIDGQTIQAYVSVDLLDEELLAFACWAFDGLDIGLQMPTYIQNQVGQLNEPWDLDPSAGTGAYPGAWGGHCVVPVDAYVGGWKFVSWGEVYLMTSAFLGTYCDEAYATLDPLAFMQDGKTIDGFDAAQLASDLQAIQAG